MDIQKYIPSEEKLKDVAGHILGNVSCWDGWDVDYGGLESDLKRFAIEIIESVLKDVSPPTTEGQNQFCITFTVATQSRRLCFSITDGGIERVLYSKLCSGMCVAFPNERASLLRLLYAVAATIRNGY